MNDDIKTDGEKISKAVLVAGFGIVTVLGVIAGVLIFIAFKLH